MKFQQFVQNNVLKVNVLGFGFEISYNKCFGRSMTMSLTRFCGLGHNDDLRQKGIPLRFLGQPKYSMIAWSDIVVVAPRSLCYPSIVKHSPSTVRGIRPTLIVR